MRFLESRTSMWVTVVILSLVVAWWIWPPELRTPKNGYVTTPENGTDGSIMRSVPSH